MASAEEKARERLQRLQQASTDLLKKEKEEVLELLLDSEVKRRAYEDNIRKMNEALDQRLLKETKLTEKSVAKLLIIDEPIAPVFYAHFVQNADGSVVADVQYRYEKPKDEAAQMATTLTMADTLTEMKQHSVQHLKLEPASLSELDLDETSIVYDDDHMSASLKDGTRFIHRNHSHGDSSSIEYHLPEVHKDDVFAQAMRIGNISALLAARNHQKTEYGRWHHTRPVVVENLPKVLDKHVSLYALAKSIEIFQLSHMGYKMMNRDQQELSFSALKDNTQNLFDFIHQKKPSLGLTQ